ncbi:MAG: hypothetical protein ACRD29_07775 [Acidimicrobiales bacterium]
MSAVATQDRPVRPTVPAPSAEHAAPGARWSSLDRAPAVALVAFLATLPLEWVTVTDAIGGFIKPFHLSAAVLAVVGLARWAPGRLIVPVLRRHGGVYLAYYVLLGAAVAGGLAFADPLLAPNLVFRQAVYAFTSVVIAGVVALIVGRGRERLLAWSGAASAAVLLVGLGVALSAGPTNPLRLVSDAVRNGDPDIISYQLLRSAFRTEADLADVVASLRHKVFLGLLVAVFLGLACLPAIARRHRLARVGLAASAVIGVTLVLLSLSRSAIVCLVIAVALVPLAMVVRNRLKPIHAAAFGLVVVVVVGLAVSPVGELLYTRFNQSGSYTARVEAAGPLFLEQFENAALLGTSRVDIERSPHNLILHSWLGGGVVAAVAAVVMLFSLGRVWLHEARRYLTGRPGWVVPINQVWVLGLGIIPFIRAFTAGNQLHMVEWTAIGVFLGLVMANDRMAAEPD